MNNEYESARMKALKLAALAAQGVDGERENAQRMLDAHLKKHGLTLQGLIGGERRERGFDAIVRGYQCYPPKLDRSLAKLAGQCLRFVCDSDDVNVFLRKDEIEVPAKRGLGWKMVKVWHVFANVTDDEFDDWRECFDHYARHLMDTMDELREAESAARRAAKMGFSMFIHEHELFPSDAVKSEAKMSLKDRIAAILAMQNVKGERWQRPAGKLQQTGFLLS